MGGLNPNALPCAPSKQQKVPKESTYDQKKNINIAKPPKWHACKKKKGNRYKNNNKKKIDKETKIFGNRFSRLREMVADSEEATDALEKAVDKDRHQNENKEKEEEENKYDVDSVETQTLDEEIKKCADQDKNESFICKRNLNEKIENIYDNSDENIDDNSSATDNKSEKAQNECYEESDCDYDSEEERNAWRLSHPESDSDCSDSETSMGSTREKWLLRNQKWKEQG